MSSNPTIKHDHISIFPRPTSHQGGKTHEVENMPPEVPDMNLYLENPVLTEAVKREGIEWAHDHLSKTGETVGSQRIRDLARLANEAKPVFKSHDRIGQRIDFVEYHPAYHELMSEAYRSGVHSLSWISRKKRPHVARAMVSYLWNQAENGIGCPNVMSFAITPLLQSDPEIGERWLSKVLSNSYDPRPLHADQKTGLTVAMSMTEKQGGCDLRANSTVAVPTGNFREYLLTGHKFFCSAPMGDLVLLTAQTEKGVTLFIAPRTLEDGTRNSIRLQRLKDKLGNISNASSEIELDDTIAYRIGEDGHGIRQFIKYMTHNIRMDLTTASAGITRHALTLALHHTTNRTAFGTPIRDLPQMRNALADMALESEAAIALGLRVAKAADDGVENEADELLNRILVPISKYWNCRRASSVTLESLECHGGMGYVEEQTIARLYREAPLNSIWEGTSAMMGLDVMRALKQTPETQDALFQEINSAGGADRHFDAFVKKLESALVGCSSDFEPNARRLMSWIAQATEASLLIRHSTPEVADAFCASRLGGEWAHEYGTLQESDETLRKIVDRAAMR
jgi:putative acyl-CoA dehydrogenase